MKIEHIAIWTTNLEKMKEFYESYFHGNPNNKYQNTKKQFESYFLTFDTGARLELMTAPQLCKSTTTKDIRYGGYAHIAFSVGSKEQVDSLTVRLKEDGYIIISEPRITGDGYYESCVLDPDGNLVEITE